MATGSALLVWNGGRRTRRASELPSPRGDSARHPTRDTFRIWMGLTLTIGRANETTCRHTSERRKTAQYCSYVDEVLIFKLAACITRSSLVFPFLEKYWADHVKLSYDKSWLTSAFFAHEKVSIDETFGRLTIWSSSSENGPKQSHLP